MAKIKFEDLKLQVEKEDYTIHEGLVMLTEINEELGGPILKVVKDGVDIIIKLEDVDNNYIPNSLVGYIGQTIKFIPIDFDENTKTIFGSIKEAQKIEGPKTMMRLKNNEPFEGTITKILPYGAYVSFGGVSGLLKDTDFSEDITKVGDLYSVGDKIRVKKKNMSAKGNLNLEAVNKYVSPNAITVDDLREEQVVLGVVRTIKGFGVFVQIARNLDALAIPTKLDIDEDQYVQFKITQIVKDEEDPSKTNVRGKILNVVS